MLLGLMGIAIIASLLIAYCQARIDIKRGNPYLRELDKERNIAESFKNFE